MVGWRTAQPSTPAPRTQGTPSSTQPNQAPPLSRPTRLCATAASAQRLCQYPTEGCRQWPLVGHGCVAPDREETVSAFSTGAKLPPHPPQPRSPNSFNPALLPQERQSLHPDLLCHLLQALEGEVAFTALDGHPTICLTSPVRLALQHEVTGPRAAFH